jgi:hypothetical protein
MEISNMRLRFALVPVAGVVFASCAAPQMLSTPLAQPNAGIARNAEHAKSWMLPEAKSEDLLYVSNVYTITVYSYPKGKLVGTLSNFYTQFPEPQRAPAYHGCQAPFASE